MRKIAIDEFWSRVRKTDGCWLYEGYVNPSGYGQIGRRYAHRIAYGAVNGAISDGLEVDHLCKVRNCVNPAHLEAVSRRENVLRSDSSSARRARQTHCKKGHPLSGDNLYVRKEGWRMCKACVNETTKAIHRRRKMQRTNGA